MTQQLCEFCETPGSERCGNCSRALAHLSVMSVEVMAAIVATSLAPLKPEGRSTFIYELGNRFCIHCGYECRGRTCCCTWDE